jgi:DNA-binding NarL/FixJ family response regulator
MFGTIKSWAQVPNIVERSYSTPAASGTGMPAQLFTAEEWHKIINRLGLSPRQSQVASLILMDFKDDAIAATLNITKATVRSHIRQMFHRTGTSSRVGLAVELFAMFRSIYRPVSR